MKNPAFGGGAAGAALALLTQNALGEGLKSVIGIFEPLHDELPPDPDQQQSPQQRAKPVRVPEPLLLAYSTEEES